MLNGLHAAGIEALALQLIGHSPAAVQAELLNTNRQAQEQALKEAREQVEREMVSRALKRHHGKIAPAAVELGISRPTLYELMEKLGIQKGEPAP